MIHTTLPWMKRMNERYGIGGKVLDVGSLDYNGNPRALFTDYTGFDMQAGPNVDVVGDIYKLPAPFWPQSFDVLLCLSVLEHVCDVGAALAAMRKVLKPGGWFYVSVPGFKVWEHNAPSDYWRFSESAVREFVLRGYAVLEFNSYITHTNKWRVYDALGSKL
jgi:SAM-dependent methyltransferase